MYAMLAQLEHLATRLITKLLKTFATKMKDLGCQFFKEDRTLLKSVLKSFVTEAISRCQLKLIELFSKMDLHPFYIHIA